MTHRRSAGPKAHWDPGLIAPVTASWSTPLSEVYVRIGISRGPPRGQRGYRMYQALAPGPWFRAVEAEEFRDRYLAQLNLLNAAEVLTHLRAMAGGRIPALLCFERPPPDPASCHRGLVSAWLADRLGVRVVEYGHEHAGWGWMHPKLKAEWRRCGGSVRI